MMTNSQTTFVLLERGVEDTALVQEIRKIEKILTNLNVVSNRDLFKEYPTLIALRQNLESEINN